jgi:transcriptional regulator with XRE-family HTH domain
MSAIDRPIGEDLRAIRQGLGLSLSQVEIKSQGLWQTVRVWSWERGHRHPTVDKVRELLAWYGGWRLALLGPGDVIHQARGADDGAGVKYSVVGHGLVVPAADREEADRIAAAMPGSRIGYQLVSAMSYVDGAA